MGASETLEKYEDAPWVPKEKSSLLGGAYKKVKGAFVSEKKAKASDFD